MFDTYKSYNSYGGPSKIDVTEKKAPTDDSVRLLSEFERKAEEKLLSVHKLDNNFFKSSWFVMQDYMNDGVRVVCKYLWNGKEGEFEFMLPSIRYMNKERFVEEINNRMKEQVSKMLLMDLSAKAGNEIIDIFRSERKW